MAIQMNLMRKVWIAALIISLTVTGCSPALSNIPEFSGYPDRRPAPTGAPASFVFDEGSQTFTLTDRRSGKVWPNGLTDEYYGQEVINKLLIRAKSQLFTITYSDESGTVTAVRNTDEEASVTAFPSGSGVTVKCEIPEAKISISVVFEEKDGTLIVTVPEKSITEAGDCTIIALELLPYFGASVDTEDGYIFYPDGCGALYDFKKGGGVEKVPYKSNVYGNYFSSLGDYIESASTGVKWPMLPVFGVKQGESAFAGIVTKGQADTILCFAPSGYIFNASRVYPVFQYRYGTSLTSVNDEEIILFEKDRYHGDFQVQYILLDKEDANVSGMARAYRSYLLENDMLKKSSYTPSVSLDLLLTVKKALLLWEQTVTASDFYSGVRMLDTLAGMDISGVRLNLLGWQKGGYNLYPSHFPVSGAAGGKRALQSLLSAAKKRNAQVALSDNFFEADSSRGGYSDRNDTAFNLMNEIYTDEQRIKYLLDVRHAYSEFNNRWMQKAKSLDISAVNLDHLGRLIYANGKKSSPIGRSAAAFVAGELAQAASKGFSNFGSAGGNEYVLPFADFLYAVPETSSRNFAFDRDVPFFHMVVHGYIPYAPEIPGNLSDNFDLTRLMWAEYGYVPYYSVSEKDASVLKDAYSDGVFVSKFSDWEKNIAQTIAEFDNKLGSLAKVPMRSWEQLSQTLVKVTYENDRFVLVNRGSEPVFMDGVTVDPMSFAVGG